MATWWSIDTEGRNPSTYTGVYGFQNFGTYSLMGSGITYPAGRAYQLAAQFAVPGNSSPDDHRQLSVSKRLCLCGNAGSGYALFLFNLSQTSAANLSVGVSNASRTSFSASTLTYGKAQYDDSQGNVWTAPVSQSLGTVGTTLPLTLPAWSMTVLKLQ